MFGPGAAEQIAAASDFFAPMQEVVSEHCFGNVWRREGLDLKTRSLVTLAMLTALGRSHEIAIHTRGALANGVTREEIRELMIHAHLYCGLPLAIEGMVSAEKVLDKEGAA